MVTNAEAYLSAEEAAQKAEARISESYGFNYGDVHVSNLGNAILTPVGTTLVVGNITSTGNDGIEAEAAEGSLPAHGLGRLLRRNGQRGEAEEELAVR